MPHRLWVWSKEEPARAILFTIATLTGLAQIGATILFPAGAANLVLVMPFCVWAVIACRKNSIRSMAWSSFWLFLLWLWTGMTSLVFGTDWTNLLWAPFLIIASTLAIIYVHLSALRRAGG